MAVIRLEALRRLECAISDAIPELEGRICTGQADAGHALAFPHLVIVPTRWRYLPDQSDEVFEPSPTCVVMDVGQHQSTVQLRVGAKTAFGRMPIEQKLIDLFLSTPLHPGVLITPVTACDELGPFNASWEMEGDEWRDEAAFDQKFYSLLEVTGTIPALVTRRGVYSFEQLQLGLEQTATPDDGETPDTFGPPSVELVQLNEDGTTSPVT